MFREPVLGVPACTTTWCPFLVTAPWRKSWGGGCRLLVSLCCHCSWTNSVFWFGGFSSKSSHGFKFSVWRMETFFSSYNMKTAAIISRLYRKNAWKRLPGESAKQSRGGCLSVVQEMSSPLWCRGYRSSETFRNLLYQLNNNKQRRSLHK